MTHENQDAWAVKAFRLFWTTAFIFSLQLYEYFNRTRWSASLCESPCHNGSRGHAAWPLALARAREPCPSPTTLQRAQSSPQPQPDSPPVYWGWRKGHKVAVTRLSNYTEKHSTEGSGQPLYLRFGKNSCARTPCSLTTCCTQRLILSLGEGAQTGHGLTLLPQVPAALWVHLSSSPLLNFPAIKVG